MTASRAAAPAPASHEGLLLTDRQALTRLAERIRERERRRQPFARELAAYERRLAEASARAAARLASVPGLSYPTDLPVSGRITEIIEAIAGNQVIVVCGETGSGKTTQLPKACLAAGRGLTGLIGHTQPRRIAARSVAARLAAELSVPLGEQVGFKVRFADTSSDRTLVRVMTDGILLAEVRDDPDLLRYDTLIVDEAHERSLNIDFLLGYLKRLLPRRPDLRVVITSATIDPERFARFFDEAPVIEVSGRGWPIETRYRPLGADEDDDLDPGLTAGIVEALRELGGAAPADAGDVLVFLPGEREIRDAADALEQAFGPALELLPLFSRLGWAEQQRVFEPGPRRRVVLATNVAETSLTVPRIRAVVDSGLARIARYSARSKILRLPIEPVSQASANQRQGRCGREGPGVCIRLYSGEDFSSREPFTPPEILRTNLANVILQMEVLGLGFMEEFPFPDPPDRRLVNDGYRLLQELEAVDGDRVVTELGRQMARIPVDPQLARMLAEARRFGALDEVLTLVAVLSIQDPRERPAEHRAAADERHAAFADPRSDFLALLRLWQAWREVRSTGGSSRARRWCRDNFLSAARMREWDELRGQLAQLVAELDWSPNTEPAAPDAVHRSLLPGLLSHIGEKTEKGDYLGARGLRFTIAPGSPLRDRPPRWLMAATLAETHRVYARTVAAIEPGWIETAAHHLVRRSYGEPEWLPERGYVSARETVTLYGLTLAAGRRVNFGAIDPAAARRIFVEEALTRGHCRLRARFLRRNARTRGRIEALEARLRRRGVLIDEELITTFYLARVPERVHSIAAFERWRREAEQQDPGLLEFRDSDIRPASAPTVDVGQLPDRLPLAGHELDLVYRFEPGADDDGVTVEVPLPLLPQLSVAELEWGVPGWRHEHLTQVIRGLPKPVRRLLVPAPDVASRCLAAMDAEPGEGMLEAAARWLSRAAGTPITPAELRVVGVPSHLRPNLRVRDLEGRIVGESRDLEALRRHLRPEQQRARRVVAEDFAREGVRTWDFGTLPEGVELERGNLTLKVYPAIEDRGNAVAITCEDSAERALRLTRRGIIRLLALRLEPPLRYLRKALASDAQLGLLHHPLGPLRTLIDDICDRAVERCCLPGGEPLPRDAGAFEAASEAGRPELYEEGMRVAEIVKQTLVERREAVAAIEAMPDRVDPALAEDCLGQLRRLAGEHLVRDAPDPWLDRLPRLLRAVTRRAEKLRLARRHDVDAQHELREWHRRLAEIETEAATRHAGEPEEVALLRWMVAEYGVSLFAQDLRTSMPVSAKRLAGQLDQARRALSA